MSVKHTSCPHTLSSSMKTSPGGRSFNSEVELFVCLLFIYFVHYKPTMQDHIFKFRLKFDLDILTKKSNIRGIPHMQNSRVDQQKTQHSVYTSLII